MPKPTIELPKKELEKLLEDQVKKFTFKKVAEEREISDFAFNDLGNIALTLKSIIESDPELRSDPLARRLYEDIIRIGSILYVSRINDAYTHALMALAKSSMRSKGDEDELE